MSFLRRFCEEKDSAISVLKRRIDTIEGLLRNLKQKYAAEYQLSENLRRTAESSIGNVEIMDKLVDMLKWYD